MENTTTTNINDINNTIEALDKLDLAPLGYRPISA